MHYRGSNVLNLASGLGRDWKWESNINMISRFVTYVKCNFCEWQFQWFCALLNENFANFNVILHEITKITELGKNWKSQPITKVKCDSMKCQKLIFRVEYTDPSLVLIRRIVKLWNSNFFIVQKVNCHWFIWNVVPKPKSIPVLGSKSKLTFVNMLIFKYFLKYESFWHNYQNMTNSPAFLVIGRSIYKLHVTKL